MTLTDHEQRLLDQQSPSQLQARAHADRMVAHYSHTEATCPDHGIILEPDEGRYCPFCGEPCDMRPVCR